uniref:calcium-binding protein 1-like n=1 Tax=Myxine glutinosa TaxID=7769 RepID=UPI00358DF422
MIALEHQRLELKAAFNEFARKGFINCAVLGNCMRTMGYMPTEMELLELSQNINMNQGGRMDFEAFVELMGPKLLAETDSMLGEKQLQDAFRELDLDGDGSITWDELHSVACRLIGPEAGGRGLRAMLHQADTNGDGRVSFDEFVQLTSL